MCFNGFLFVVYSAMEKLFAFSVAELICCGHPTLTNVVMVVILARRKCKLKSKEIFSSLLFF
jgi:hypothetical protein